MRISKPIVTSLLIGAGAIALSFLRLPNSQKTLHVVAGTEIQAPLEQIERQFEKDHPYIQIELSFLGSQEMVNRYINRQFAEPPDILIPAAGEVLQELNERWRAQTQSEAFIAPPEAIVKTQLVAIAWQDRGAILFPSGQFQWSTVEAAMTANNWQKIGGPAQWGSFDFVITDPARSNSGQLALTLWSAAKLTEPLSPSTLNSPPIQSLFELVHRSVYEPPRSSDTLLREFISRGSNDADLAITYESIALARWQQSAASQGKPYRVYYLSPTIETISTAAIPTTTHQTHTSAAAQQFVDYLKTPTQQSTFVQFGFRPTNNSVALQSVPNSPWTQGIPGIIATPLTQTIPAPDPTLRTEIIRQWERAQ